VGLAVAVCHTRPPVLGSWSFSLTLAADRPVPGLLTTMVKLAWPFWLKVPLSGVLSTVSCAGAGVHVSEPASCALGVLSDDAMAAGLGCVVQAASGVVGVELTVTIAEAPAAIEPRLQLSALLPLIEQLPWLALAVSQTRPPLLGSWS